MFRLALISGAVITCTVAQVPSGIAGYACQAKGLDQFPFCDTSLDIDSRVDDLISRIDLARAGEQLTARESPAYPELGVPDFYWGTNALHSIREYLCFDGRCPTSFPIPPSYGASFNMSLVRDMARAMAYELRAAYNKDVTFNDHSTSHRPGLTTWSPTINIVRDPRWGRNVEVPSEDPYLTGQYAKAYTEGAQNGPSDKYPLTAVTLKHWLAYSLEDYDGVTRHNFNAEASAYDLASTYYPGFEPAIKEAKAMGVMCSYNRVNGVPTCGNPELTKVLREDWGFDGYITSDTDACKDIYKTHHYAKDAEHAVADCLAGGTDINSGDTYSKNLQAAVEAGVATLEDTNAALRNAFKVRFRLGLFDPKEKDENRDIPWEVVGSEEHKAWSLLAARQSMTLLKNEEDVLPFNAGRSLAVIGTDANALAHTIGNYESDNICLPGDVYSKNVNTDCLTSIWDELRNRTTAAGGEATLVTRDSGKWDAAAITAAVDAARDAEQVLLFASNFETEGSEGKDVTTVALEPTQHAMIEAVLAVKPQAALVLINGGIIGWDSTLARAAAVLDAWQPGAYGGVAVAETVFGEHNPGGKLPVTLYHANYTEQSDFKNMSMTHGPGRTYRYIEPSFPVAYSFGHGLSYTSFALQWPDGEAPGTVTFSDANDSAVFNVEVANTGAVAGDEVVQVYVKPPRSLATLHSETPIVQKQLIAFQRMSVAAGGQTKATFEVDAKAFGLADTSGNIQLHAGDYNLLFSKGHGKDLEVPVKVQLQLPAMLKPFRKWWNDDSQEDSQLYV